MNEDRGNKKNPVFHFFCFKFSFPPRFANSENFSRFFITSAMVSYAVRVSPILEGYLGPHFCKFHFSMNRRERNWERIGKQMRK